MSLRCRPAHVVRILFAAAALILVLPPAQASGLAQLHAFLEGTHTASGAFRQTVVNAQHRTTQQSSGTFAFERPGRFRWTYDKPYAQVIVGDGERVWVYDKDLEQVMVRKLDAALGSTPAALLAGDNALEQHFALAEGPVEDGLEFIVATPKGSDSQFKRISLGFRDNLPQAMVLVDAFGQTTSLRFSNVVRNPTLSPDLFRFTPPPGVDVVGDRK